MEPNLLNQSSKDQKLTLAARRNSAASSLEKLQIPPLDSTQEVIMLTNAFMYEGQQIDDDTVQEGKDLLTNFISSEIKRHPDLSKTEVPLLHTRPTNHLWEKTGRDLRDMADSFAETEQRKAVKRRAQEMKIDEMTKRDFLDLLRELFSEGITRERIVVLFFFCSDVAINALRGPENLFSQFFNWSLDFVTGFICSWVFQNGGWKKVLSKPFNSINKVLMWAGVAVSLFVFFRLYRRNNFIT